VPLDRRQIVPLMAEGARAAPAAPHAPVIGTDEQPLPGQMEQEVLRLRNAIAHLMRSNQVSADRAHEPRCLPLPRMGKRLRSNFFAAHAGPSWPACPSYPYSHAARERHEGLRTTAASPPMPLVRALFPPPSRLCLAAGAQGGPD
jgi:hypothetical protein